MVDIISNLNQTKAIGNSNPNFPAKAFVRLTRPSILRSFTLVIGHKLCRLVTKHLTICDMWSQFVVPCHKDGHFVVFSGGELYAGTAADFAQSDSLIIRGALRTEQFEGIM